MQHSNRGYRKNDVLDLSGRHLKRKDLPQVFAIVAQHKSQRVDLSSNLFVTLSLSESQGDSDIYRAFPKCLRELDLSKNQLKVLFLPGPHDNITHSFSDLVNLRALNLSKNLLESLDGLHHLVNLEFLNLANNKLDRVDGLETLSKLCNLNLAENLISTSGGIRSLSLNRNLRTLKLSGNPLASQKNYRVTVMHFIPSVGLLDGVKLAPSSVRKKTPAKTRPQKASPLNVSKELNFDNDNLSLQKSANEERENDGTATIRNHNIVSVSVPERTSIDDDDDYLVQLLQKRKGVVSATKKVDNTTMGNCVDHLLARISEKTNSIEDFSQALRDGDIRNEGIVSRGHFRQVLEQFDLIESRASLRALYQALDTDKDESINYSILLNHQATSAKKETTGGSTEQQFDSVSENCRSILGSKMESIMHIFKAVDSRDCGEVSLLEFFRCLINLNLVVVPEVEHGLRGNYTSESLEHLQAIAIIAHMADDQSDTTQRMRNTFEGFSMSHNGLLPVDDFIKALSQSECCLWKDECVKTAKSLDVENEGYINYTNFLHDVELLETELAERAGTKSTTLDRRDVRILIRILLIENGESNTVCYRKLLNLQGDQQRDAVVEQQQQQEDSSFHSEEVSVTSSLLGNKSLTEALLTPTAELLNSKSSSSKSLERLASSPMRSKGKAKRTSTRKKSKKQLEAEDFEVHSELITLRNIIKKGHRSLYGRHIENFKATFKAFDRDHDGHVNSEEFFKGCHRLGIGLSRNRTMRLFRVLDHDGDGLIEYEWFFNALHDTLHERTPNSLIKEMLDRHSNVSDRDHMKTAVFGSRVHSHRTLSTSHHHQEGSRTRSKVARSASKKKKKTMTKKLSPTSVARSKVSTTSSKKRYNKRSTRKKRQTLEVDDFSAYDTVSSPPSKQTRDRSGISIGNASLMDVLRTVEKTKSDSVSLSDPVVPLPLPINIKDEEESDSSLQQDEVQRNDTEEVVDLGILSKGVVFKDSDDALTKHLRILLHAKQQLLNHFNQRLQELK
eukprot:g1337.t1